MLNVMDDNKALFTCCRAKIYINGQKCPKCDE